MSRHVNAVVEGILVVVVVVVVVDPVVENIFHFCMHLPNIMPYAVVV